MAESPIVGQKNVLTTPQTLTGSFVTLAESGAAAYDTAVFGQVINQVAVAISYTGDAGATNPAIQLQVQFGVRGAAQDTPPTAASDWYTEQAESSFTAGVSTIVDHVYNRAGTAGTAVNFIVPVPATALWVRVQAKETKDAGNFGVATAKVFYQYN